MIVDIVRDLIESLTPIANPEGGADLPFTFYHSEEYEMNGVDSPTVPYGLLCHPVKGYDIIRRQGVAGTRYPLLIMFNYKSRLEMLMSEREGMVNKMILAKDEFIKKCVELINVPQNTADPDHEFLVEIGSSNHEEIYNMFDHNADGVELKIELITSKNPCFFLSSH